MRTVTEALALPDRLLWQPGLTEDNVRRIRPGMALAEVEALLSGPASLTVDMRALARDFPGVERSYRWLRVWKESGAHVDVQFFADGRVMAAAGREHQRPGIFARLRTWLGW
jgi:hypothetical protein